MRAAIERTGAVTVDRPAAEAFGLFTPEGERSWVPAWDPVYTVGGHPDPAPGLIFITDTDKEARTWVITRFDPAARRAGYAYFLPGRRAAWIDVMVEPVDAGASLARVTYRMTAIGPAGDEEVRAFGEGFDAMLEDWRRRIAR